MHLDERDYDFGAVALGALEQRRRAFDDKGIEVSRQLPAEPVPVRGDADKIARAMSAILDNAAKFTPASGRVMVTVAPEVDSAVFAVVDSGEGIPAGVRDRIFDPFYQVDGSPTRAHDGVGLGLALAKRIVEMMGGTIWVESPPVPAGFASGRGTRVAFRVPRQMRRTVLSGPPR
jgi:signal transduction histidine kinase